MRRCIDEGLVGGDGFAVDASLIRAEANRQTYVEGTQGLPADAPRRAVEEYLAVLDDAAFGRATPVEPKRVSPVDPAARYTQAHGGRADFCYSTNYLIDVDNAVIVDVEASTAVRQAEVTAAKRMIERAAERHDLWPRKLIGDTGYGSAGMLAWLVHERGIEPHVPVFDKFARSDGAFERSDFTFDHEDDSYICPAGKRLRPRNRNFASPRPEADKDGFIRYRARQQDCTSCALKPQCTPILPARKVTRSVHEGARDLARLVTGRRMDRLAPRAQEGRDAVRAPQAHHAARPAAITRPQRRPRRIPPRRGSPEPAQARQDQPRKAAGDGLRSGISAQTLQSGASVSAKMRLFQQHPPYSDDKRLSGHDTIAVVHTSDKM